MSFDLQALLFPGLFLLLCALCAALALIDLRHGIIPDGLNLAIAGLGLASAIVAGGGAGELKRLGERSRPAGFAGCCGDYISPGERSTDSASAM
jgi:hypothetical protein